MKRKRTEVFAMREGLNLAYLSQEKGILRYLNPAFLSVDNEKYMKMCNRLAPLYDFGENFIDWKRFKGYKQEARRIDTTGSATVRFIQSSSILSLLINLQLSYFNYGT